MRKHVSEQRQDKYFFVLNLIKSLLRIVVGQFDATWLSITIRVGSCFL